MLVININGVHIMDEAARGEIVYHIELDDILYVMGQGDRLKLGFVIHSYEEAGEDDPDVSFTDSEDGAVRMASHDCRTEVLAARMPGLKARAIAEDIIGYCQLSLVECTRNDVISLKHDHKHDHDHGPQKADDPLHEAEQIYDVKDMMDSEDVESLEDTLLGAVGHASHSHPARAEGHGHGHGHAHAHNHHHNHHKHGSAEPRERAETPAERYKRELRKQIGSGFGLKDADFFCYSRRPPLLTPYVGRAYDSD